MTTRQTPPSPYWYGGDTEDLRGSRLLDSLRAYRAAEMAMRHRAQNAMSMGENEVIVLHFLTRAARSGQDVTPADLARHLGVSTASMTALLDRLEKAGHLQRHRHPTDRRKLLVVCTRFTEDQMRDTLGTMHERMMRATRGMSEAESAVVAAFLDRMTCAVAGACRGRGPACCRVALPSEAVQPVGGAA